VAHPESAELAEETLNSTAHPPPHPSRKEQEVQKPQPQRQPPPQTQVQPQPAKRSRSPTPASSPNPGLARERKRSRTEESLPPVPTVAVTQQGLEAKDGDEEPSCNEESQPMQPGDQEDQEDQENKIVPKAAVAPFKPAPKIPARASGVPPQHQHQQAPKQIFVKRSNVNECNQQ